MFSIEVRNSDFFWVQSLVDNFSEFYMQIPIEAAGLQMYLC